MILKNEFKKPLEKIYGEEKDFHRPDTSWVFHKKNI